MMPMKIVLRSVIEVTFCLIFAFILISCKKTSSVEPEELKPGRRDYTWRVDTVSYPFLDLMRIWGSSPEDVWVVGEASEIKNRVWHFDGSKWSNPGDLRLYVNYVFGFAKDDIWASADGFRHYYGSGWSNKYTPKIDSLPNGGDLDFWDMNGKNTNDIWAVGHAHKNKYLTYGIIYQYYIGAWNRKYISKQSNFEFYEVHPTGDGDKCLVWGLKRDYQTFLDSSAIFEYDGKDSLKEIFSSPFNVIEACWIKEINHQIYIVMNNKVYRYNNGEMSFFSSNETLGNGIICGGRSEKDIFIWKPDYLDHYNGTDVKTIFRMKNPIQITDNVITFGNIIFFFAKDKYTGDYYMVRGELKNTGE